MATMTTEHSTNLILDDLDTRNLNWLDVNRVFDGSTAIPLAMSSGTITESAFSSGSIEDSSIKTYTEPFVTIPTAGGALTIDLSSGNVFKITMTSTITSITYSGASTSETVPFTLQFYPLSTATLTITGQAAYSVVSASTSLVATNSCGFTGVFSTLIEPGDIIDVSGFTSTESTANDTDWRVISASADFIGVYLASEIYSTTAPATGVTISRRRDIFAGGSTGFSTLTPYTPTAYVGYTFDGDRFYMAAVGDL
jgi:hypothetical protein